MEAAAVTADESGALFERVQELQALLDGCEQSTARDLAEELMSTVLQLYGSGLERIIGGVLASGPDGARIASKLAEDPLVATLLLIHDLHPISLEERVQAALDSVRPYMDSHGGNVELLSLDGGVARIRLQGSCSDCSASSVTLELAIKQALEDAAPDLEGLEVEGVAPQMPGLALPMASGGNGAELPVVMSPAWFEVDPGGEPASGSLAAVTVAGQHACDRQRRGHAAGVSRRLRRVRERAPRGGACRGRAALSTVRALVLPPARRTLHG